MFNGISSVQCRANKQNLPAGTIQFVLHNCHTAHWTVELLTKNFEYGRLSQHDGLMAAAMETTTLAALNDTLLFRLMVGVLLIYDAEQITWRSG